MGNYPINISDGKQEKTHYQNRNQHPEMSLPRVGNKLTANWRCSREDHNLLPHLSLVPC